MNKPAPLLPRLWALLLIIACAAAAGVACAHEVRPAYLEIDQRAADRFEVVWKQPTMGEVAIHLTPHLSNGWLDRPPTDQYAAEAFLIRKWSIVSSKPSIEGATVSIEGLQDTVTDVFVRLRRWSGGPQPRPHPAA